MRSPFPKDQTKIAVIGGGTGSFVLLGALKDQTSSIAALVNMADDGGSTGTLRDELGALPPGDVRQCLVALSNVPGMRDLFNYRFEEGGLKGHAVGNLFLTALEKMTGDFAEAVERASEVLNITGVVAPITLTNVRLVMEDADGTEVVGEYKISDSVFHDPHPKLRLVPEAAANPTAIAAIMEADVVVIAPGNLYSSLAPAVIVPGIGEVLMQTRAYKVYVCNLVTKPGQTDGFTVADFVSELHRLAGSEFLDAVIYNTEKPSDELLSKYARQGELAVGFDNDELARQTYRAIGRNLLAGSVWQGTSADPIAPARTLIRHDAEAVASAIMEVYDSWGKAKRGSL